jgi:hypothetical protein
MHDAVLVAVITGCVALSNGILSTILNRRWKRNDKLAEMRSDISRLYHMVDRLGKGLCLGLENDKVIFKAFREHAINGESETQEERMDTYFRECAVHDLKAGDGKEG